ncbi:MAG TPA: mechanosensitive ion channel domain-containing protein [Candidatus Acidoferrum sp.]|nr:mechanosensitive ion channel domain-containing protein [Candidatus Acidoferrum sp.]
MRTAQKIAAGALILGLGAAAYGIFLLGHASTVSAKKKAAASENALVDHTPFKTAQQLAQLADTPEEQELAKEVLRLGDYELDLSFAVALQDAEAHPADLSAEAKEIKQRLQKNQKLAQALEAQVNQLTLQAAKATGQRKADLQDQLDMAKASLDVANNDVDDASRDLTDAGGNQRDRIEKMKGSHEEADKARKDPDKIFPQRAEDKIGLVHRFQQWSALNAKKKLLQNAKSEADILVASLSEQHQALSAQLDAEKFNSPDLAAHSKLAQQSAPESTPASAESAIAAVTGAIAKSRSTEEKKSVLATTKSITLDQKNLASLDKRADNEKELSQNYAQWLDLVSDRQRLILRRILAGCAVVLGIALIGLFFNSWLEKILGKLRIDRRQMQTLRATARVSVQVLAALLVLLVILGPPTQLGTFIGLATAGLTVALKDFIVGFLGWFVLMGKNGIRLGDWVEINGVTGEVVEIGLFHTVLLETGNWTDSGHPTGRRVTFTNSYAIEGHYFNFSTSGQWLWDELQVVLPTGDDPYPVIEAIQKRVLEATQEGAKSAAQEWKSAAGNRDIGSFSAEPSINLRPVLGGVELSVRYITQANQRYQLRTKLNQAAVELLGHRGLSPVAPSNPAPATGD